MHLSEDVSRNYISNSFWGTFQARPLREKRNNLQFKLTFRGRGRSDDSPLATGGAIPWPVYRDRRPDI